MALFLLVGMSALFRRERSTRDYLIAGRQLGPLVSALSAASTTCSGFMFIGLIGLSYKQGIFAFWFFIGISFGNLLVWRFLVPGLRREAGRVDAETYLSFLLPREHNQAAGKRGISGEEVKEGAGYEEDPRGVRSWRAARLLAGFCTLLFLGLYAAAQLRAGTKALDTLFELPPSAGILIGAGVIWAYCLAGGYRATVWSDAAQSVVMFAAMLTLAFSAFNALGGWDGLMAQLAAQDPALTQLWPPERGLDPLWVGLGWLWVGLGVFGQPHIMIRPIALKSVDAVTRTRQIYFIYYLAFVALSVFVGICARALIPPGGVPFDPELALPKLAMAQLSPALVGLILAGVFASTISTADSQVLACAAVLGHDLRDADLPPEKAYRRQRWATSAVIIGAALTALAAPTGVFTLVIAAWSALAAIFVPLGVLRVQGDSLSGATLLAMLLSPLALFTLSRFLGLSPLVELSCCWGGAALSYLFFERLPRRSRESL